MMQTAGFVSYLTGAILSMAVALLCLYKGRSVRGRRVLALAAAANAAWCFLLARQALVGMPFTLATHLAEVLRTLSWCAVAVHALNPLRRTPGSSATGRYLLPLVAVAGIGLIAGPVVYPLVAGTTLNVERFVVQVTAGYVVLCVLALWLVELWFRNVREDERWSIKFQCFAIGGLLVYDFFLYSHAALFRQMDMDLWVARGAVNAVFLPLLAWGEIRRRDSGRNLFVSREMVVYSTTLVGAGFYLLLMAVTGYYLRVAGGSFGPVLQVVFLAGAGLMLLLLLFSGRMRAGFKVFLGKHFHSYRFDYRNEWLGFTRALSACKTSERPMECLARAVADRIDSPAAQIWLVDESGDFGPTASWNMQNPSQAAESANGSLVSFLAGRNWVIDLDEYAESPDLYGDLILPDWLRDNDQAWLLVPLNDETGLQGFMVLARPRARLGFDWEVRDLIRTAATQATVHLMQIKAYEALAEARQFEGFNRLASFILHDLKNLIAQQSLVVSGAEKHRDNPAFVDDAFQIMSHSVGKMNRLMGLLKSGMSRDRPLRLDIRELIEETLRNCQTDEPLPDCDLPDTPIMVVSERDRLVSVLEHLVHNAQEATPTDGSVTVTVSVDDGRVEIRIIDTGQGMDEKFVRERLFRPFDTTKGDTGMGIGVYEAREYVQAIGGRILVQSRPGEGSCFTVSLPLAEGDARPGMVSAGSSG